MAREAIPTKQVGVVKQEPKSSASIFPRKTKSSALIFPKKTNPSNRFRADFNRRMRKARRERML